MVTDSAPFVDHVNHMSIRCFSRKRRKSRAHDWGGGGARKSSCQQCLWGFGAAGIFFCVCWALPVSSSMQSGLWMENTACLTVSVRGASWRGEVYPRLLSLLANPVSNSTCSLHHGYIIHTFPSNHLWGSYSAHQFIWVNYYFYLWAVATDKLLFCWNGYSLNDLNL